jgi:MFS family permease
MPSDNDTNGRIAAVPVETPEQARRVVTGRIHWRNTFAAFRHYNYRLFFAGQFVSLIGTWMQSVAQGWLVYDLSRSAFVLGLVNFLTAIPVTAFTVMGGAVADRSNKRTLLIVMQTLAMALAFLLAGLVYSGHIAVWHVAVIGFFFGITNAFEIPTRQSFIIDLVGKDDLMNAIALNSSMFHAARVCGPALAGFLIGVIGVAGCFTLNGVSFLAVIAGYIAMRLAARPQRPETRPIAHATLEAVRYVRNESTLSVIMIMMAVTSIFALPYIVMLPAFARDVLHTGAAGLGYLMTANGMGALLGALTLASLGDHPHKRRLFYAGIMGFSMAVILFSLSRHFWISAGVLVLAGFCMIIAFATANTAVQIRTPDHLRGRVMGIYTMAFLGLSPFGSLLAGLIAKWTSVPIAVGTNAGICLIVAILVAGKRRNAANPSH